MADNKERPSVLNNVSETQIDELERQYDEKDREAWNHLTSSYGWSDADSQAVWDWFGNKVAGESSNS